MKNIILLAVCLFFIHSLSAQQSLTAAQWQEDLRFLQEKVHREYKHLFYKTTKEHFDEAVEKLYKDIPNLEDHKIITRLAEIVGSFGYGHTGIWLSAWRYGPVVNFHQLPLNFYWFKDGIYIQGAHKDYEQALGARVIKIENTPVEEVLQAIKPTMSVENDQFYKAHGMLYLGVPEVLHAKGIIEDMTSVKLILEKEVDEIKNQLSGMANNAVYRYYDFENNINEAAYFLANQGENQKALALFEFNTQLFPNAANPWDSLAEMHLYLGNKEKAKEYYKKAIQLDPEGEVGKNARSRLNTIKEK